jgi:hypothetical protein
MFLPKKKKMVQTLDNAHDHTKLMFSALRAANLGRIKDEFQALSVLQR